MLIQHDLAAATAWRDQPSITISGGGDRDERPGTGRGCDAQHHELSARPTREVVDVHRSVHPSPGVHGYRRDRVVRIAPQRSRQRFRLFDDSRL